MTKSSLDLTSGTYNETETIIPIKPITLYDHMLSMLSMLSMLILNDKTV